MGGTNIKHNNGRVNMSTSCKECKNSIVHNTKYLPCKSVLEYEPIECECGLVDNWDEDEYGEWDDDYLYELKPCPAFR
jgi:hypothetical protein